MSIDITREPLDEMQRKLDAGWEEIVSTVGRVPAGELERPGVVGEWSVKDLLGHMAFWADKAARDLHSLSAGSPNDIETTGSQAETDEWNEREHLRRKDLPLAEVRAEWEQAHGDARRELAGIREDLLWRDVKGWPQAMRFREDTYNHYKEHAEHIREWLRQTETSET